MSMRRLPPWSQKTGELKDFERLDHGGRGAELLPEVFAGGGIEREDVAGHVLAGRAFLEALEVEDFIALEHLDVELAAVERGAAAVGPLGGKGTVRLGEVALPLKIARVVVAGGDGVGEEEDDAVAVGDGGGGGEVALVVPLKVAFEDDLAPEFLAGVGVVAEADEFLLGFDRVR